MKARKKEKEVTLRHCKVQNPQQYTKKNAHAQKKSPKISLLSVFLPFLDEMRACFKR